MRPSETSDRAGTRRQTLTPAQRIGQFFRATREAQNLSQEQLAELTRRRLLADVAAGDEFYFVHSYYPEPDDENVVCAVADYEGRFCCALARGNYFATQFHPEKSGRVGLALLANFAVWNGAEC